MRLGKLTPSEITQIITGLRQSRGEVLLSGSLGEDCAVLKCPDYILVTSDPITWECKNLGALAIHISANDIYAGGGEPFAASITVIAHPEAPLEEIKRVMKDAEETASALDIDIVGGHTEWSDCVVRTIASVTMLGRTKRPVYTRSAKKGDLLIMTKYAGIEGTAILAGTKKDILKNTMTDAEIAEAEGLISKLSIREEAEIAFTEEISAMHDVTEGGISGAAFEMCGGKEIIKTDKIPMLEVTKKLTDALGIDPYGLIGSGSLLIAASPAAAERLLKKFNAAGINAAVIGETA